MAFPKHGRQERRGPSTHVIIFGSLFVAFLLIGVWVYTSPAPIEEVVETKTVSQTSSFDIPRKGDVLEEAHVASSARERAEESKGLEAEETKEADKVGESEEVGDEPVKREEEGPEVDESTILDKSTEEAKSELSSAEEDGDAEPVMKDSKVEEVLEESAEELPADVVDVGSDDEVGSTWKSQDKESKDEKEVRKNSAADEGDPEVVPDVASTATEDTEQGALTEEEKKIEENQQLATTPIVIQEEVAITDVEKYKWKLCNWRGSQDYIPCLDNKKWLSTHRARKHYEHRERHCPIPEELPKCLVPLPPGYKAHIKWPESRNEVCHLPCREWCFSTSPTCCL
jgi:hypothetical protein